MEGDSSGVHHAAFDSVPVPSLRVLRALGLQVGAKQCCGLARRQSQLSGLVDKQLVAERVQAGCGPSDAAKVYVSFSACLLQRMYTHGVKPLFVTPSQIIARPLTSFTDKHGV